MPTFDETIENPIKAIDDGSRNLRSTQQQEFSRQWMLHALLVEFYRYSFEDDYVDTESPAVRKAKQAYAALLENRDWLHPHLTEFLTACSEVARMPELPSKSAIWNLETEGLHVPVITSEASSSKGMVVSDRTTDTVPIFENTLSDPKANQQLVRAFSSKIDRLKEVSGTNHLVFVEKEVGPVGALPMMSSLVIQTGLPASIYRSTHWAERAAIAGQRPNETDRITIIYDLVVSGTGICTAADDVKALTGATTVAAIALCGYGAPKNELRSRADQTIALDALGWRDQSETDFLDEPLSRGQSEDRTHSDLREQPREEKVMPDPQKKDRLSPGYYTPATMPPLSPGAKKMLEEVIATAERRSQESGPVKHTRVPGNNRKSGLGIAVGSRKGGVGIKVGSRKGGVGTKI